MVHKYAINEKPIAVVDDQVEVGEEYLIYPGNREKHNFKVRVGGREKTDGLEPKRLGRQANGDSYTRVGTPKHRQSRGSHTPPSPATLVSIDLNSKSDLDKQTTKRNLSKVLKNVDNVARSRSAMHKPREKNYSKRSNSQQRFEHTIWPNDRSRSPNRKRSTSRHAVLPNGGFTPKTVNFLLI
uniref:Miff domain-containing protein n=1 Tax=Mesocestoides corti TaxID=53468 RepID=A0A5K3ET47_MESCO